jgi:hypothetical protein
MATRPLSSLLDRFRRGVAVPAGVGDDLAMELAPVFASLEQFEEEAQAVQRRGTQEAESRLEQAREQAARISATWREEAEIERTRAAEQRRRRSRDEARAVEAEARAEAGRIRRQASARMPILVEEILACVERGAAVVRPRTPEIGDDARPAGHDATQSGRREGAPPVAHGEREP